MKTNTRNQCWLAVVWGRACAFPKTLTISLPVLILAVNPAQAATLTWDNGAGTYNWTTDANWSGSIWNSATPDDAIFGATGVGSVNVIDPTTANSVTINAEGYTLADGGGTLQVNGAITNNADSTQLSAILVGGLTLEGTGNLDVAQLETYAGSTMINGGTLTIDATSGGLYYSGDGVIRINSGGTLSLSGSISYANQALHFIDPGAGSIIINGGTWQHTGPGTGPSGAQHLFTIGALGATLDSATAGEQFTLGYRYDYQAPGVVGSTAGGTLTLSGDGDGELNYLLQGTGGLIKTGAGTWKLSNINTYSGDTVVMAGTLALASGTDNGGQGHGSITSPSITVSNGATFDVSLAVGGFTLSGSQSLGGNGSIVGAVSTSSGSSVYAGLDGAYGTNTFTSDLSLASGGLCYFDLGTTAGGANDLIVVEGNLLLNGPVFHIKAPSTSASLDTSADYVLVKVTGTISGSAAATPVWDVAPVNAADFKVLKVGNNLVLRSVTGTPPSAIGSAIPATVTHFQKLTISVTVTPGSSPISTVILNAAPIGGSASVALVSAGGNVYTNTVTVGGVTPLGVDTVLVTVTDTSSLTAGVNIPFTVTSASRVWNGAGPDDNWSTTANWIGGAGPGLSGDSVVFAGTTRLTPFLENNYAVMGVTFDATAGSFTLGGTGTTLTLSGSGVTNNSADAQDLEVPLALALPQTFDTAVGDIILGQVVSGSGGLIKVGSSNLTLSAAEMYTGSTTINGGTLTVGSKLYANSGGPITINLGGVLSLPAGDFGWGASLGFLDVTANTIIINGGTLRHTGSGNGQTVNGAGHLFTIGALGATLDSATAGETFAIGFRYDYTPILTSSAGGTLTLTGEGDGVMDYTLPGSGGVTKTGSGTWTLSRSNNTFTGDVTVQSGTLIISYPTIAATATVLIETNALLSLSFSEVNQVGALVVGRVPMPPGTYDATTSPSYLSGSGSLLVSAYPHPQISSSVSENSLNLSWPQDYTGWKLLVQTNNLAKGISSTQSDWAIVPGSTATNMMVLPVDTGKPTEFYRLSY